LAASRTVEEEMFDLFAIQVAIVVKGHQHCDIARGEALDEDLIREIMARQDLVVASEEVTGDPDGLRNQSWGRLGLL
jgi:hypothetical protein